MITPSGNTPFGSSKKDLSPVIIAVSIVVVVMAILLGGTYVLRNQLKSKSVAVQPTSVTTTPMTATTSLIPPLNNQASNNPNNPTAQVWANFNTQTALADLQPSQGAAAITQTINQRLQLGKDDQDYDGLANATEVLIYGTNPNYYDTDLDGIPDKQEIDQGTNPLKADEPMSDEYKQLVQSRITHWGTDFAVTADKQAQAQRDQARIADAGKARVLLFHYYEENKHYPTATSWEKAWADIKAKNTAEMFGSDSSYGQTPIMDPLNQAPYVYTYQPLNNGQSFTFTYTLETDSAHFVVSDSQGQDQPVKRVEFIATSPSPAAKTSQALPFIPVAEAQTASPAIQSPGDIYCNSKNPPAGPGLVLTNKIATTKDGKQVAISEGYCAKEGPYWYTFATHHTLAQLQADFQRAINVEISRHKDIDAYTVGHCDNFGCYCLNGAQLLFNPKAITQCTDKRDNDGDKLIDAADPGCHVNNDLKQAYDPTDNDEYNPIITQCNDTKDNDGDKLIDASDPGCHYNNDPKLPYNPLDDDESNPLPITPYPDTPTPTISTPTPTATATITPPIGKTACEDKLDNDNDGRIDAKDPACHIGNDLTKPYDPTRTTETDPACSDLKDNDGDGKVDSADPGCRATITDPNSYNPAKDNEANPPFNPSGFQEVE